MQGLNSITFSSNKLWHYQNDQNRLDSKNFRRIFFSFREKIMFVCVYVCVCVCVCVCMCVFGGGVGMEGWRE